MVLNADRQTEAVIQLVPVPPPGLGEERAGEHRRKHAFGCSTRTWKLRKMCCGVPLLRGNVDAVFPLHLRTSWHHFRLVPSRSCGGGAVLQRFNFSTATDATTDATKRAPLKVAQDAKNTV